MNLIMKHDGEASETDFAFIKEDEDDEEDD